MSAPALPESSASRSEPIPAAKPARVRLEFLDGLRGAAFYVVLHHVYHELNWQDDGGGLPLSVLRLSKVLAYGYFAVGVFIVLSGYCLMLPIAQSPDGALKGGFTGYIHRRARRILPPYYAALVLTLLLIAVTPGLQHPAGAHWDSALPALSPGPILSHLLLAHNLFGAWSSAIDPPMWSVAVEWQIYFLFPLLLLPLWRRFGNAAFLAAAFCVAFVPSRLSIPYLEQAQWIFLMPFALGMLGALISFSPTPAYRALRDRLPWGVLATALCLVMGIAGLMRPGILMHNVWISLPLVGSAVMGLLIFCAKALSGPELSRMPLVLRLLQSRALTGLGMFSYSLYLVHFPILALVHVPLRTLHLSPLARYGLLFVIAVPLSVGAAYLFHLAFERRFMLPTKQASGIRQ